MTVNKIIILFDPQTDKNQFYDDQVLSKVFNTKIRKLSEGEIRYMEIKLILSLL